MSRKQTEVIEHQPAALPPTPSASGGGGGGDGDALIAMIERAARDPNVDIDKMERLFALQKEARAFRAQQEYNEAFAAAQAEMQMHPVVRDKENEHTRSWYARLESITKAIMPIATKYGFSVSVNEDIGNSPEGMVRMVGIVRHRGGHSERFETDVPLDLYGAAGKINKTAVHGKFSSTTYARRYLQTWIWNLAIVDQSMDDDGNAAGMLPEPETIDADEIKAMEGLIRQAKVNVDQFKKFLKVESLDQVKKNNYGAAMQVLRDRVKQQREGK